MIPTLSNTVNVLRRKTGFLSFFIKIFKNSKKLIKNIFKERYRKNKKSLKQQSQGQYLLTENSNKENKY